MTEKKIIPDYVIGIGASAGGLEALELLIKHLPKNSNCAFIIIQHLSPDFKSFMAEILLRHTTMEVATIDNQEELQANTIYLNSPKKDLIIDNNLVKTFNRKSGSIPHTPINTLFYSLAECYREKAIAIVLSGTGSDGSLGLKAVREAGGFTIVQSIESAKFDGMPRAALKTGNVNAVILPELVGELLQSYINDPAACRKRLEETNFLPGNDQGIQGIYQLMLRRYSVDFTQYKDSTIHRRIKRRMSMCDLENINEYTTLIAHDQNELETLYRDLLIEVTSFFRDAEAFDYLARVVCPNVIKQCTRESQIRVWVPGCATGEEAYSIAMILDYSLKARNLHNDFKIYATDLHAKSLNFAATGLFSPKSIEFVPHKYRKKYFYESNNKYKIVTELRRKVVFANHNVVMDPPFTKMDIISCRNLLIYLLPSIQQKVISNFHFALKHHGILFLGASETLGYLRDEFGELNRKWRIYEKRRDVKLSYSYYNNTSIIPTSTSSYHTESSQKVVANIKDSSLADTYNYILDNYACSGFIINCKRECIRVLGNAGQYLRLPTGETSFDLLTLVEGELRMALGSCFHRSKKDKTKNGYRNISVKLLDQTTVKINLFIDPIMSHSRDPDYFLVEIEEVKLPDTKPISNLVTNKEQHFDANKAAELRIEELEEELRRTKEHLQTTIEELESSNEELQSTNEELLAANEELQSTNEELHSVNEELYTVNADHASKIDELAELNDDVNNLFESIEVGTIFLDNELKLRRFTPAVVELFNLRDIDIGRRLEHFSNNLIDVDIISEIRTVIASKYFKERRVVTDQGSVLLMRILPYQREGDTLDGVILTFTNISHIEKTETELLELNQALSHAIEGISIINKDKQYVYVNTAYSEIVGFKVDELQEQHWYKTIAKNEHDCVALAYDEMINHGKAVCEIKGMKKDNSLSYQRLTLVKLEKQSGDIDKFFCFVQDITQQKILQNEIKDSYDRIRFCLEHVGVGFWDWDLTTQKINFSDNWVRMLGYERSDIEADRNFLKTIIHPEDFEKAQLQREKHIKGTTSFYECELRLRLKTGQYCHILDKGVVVERDENDCAKRMIGVDIDISKQKEVQQALLENEQRYQTILNSVTDGWWDCDAETGEEYLSPSFKALFGYHENELNEKPNQWYDILQPQAKVKVINAHKNTIKNGEPYELIINGYHKDGGLKWFIRRGVGLKNEKGFCTRVVGTHTDITQLKDFERALQKSNQELEEFAHIASHDLKEPLRGIHNYAFFLLEDNKESLNEESRFHLESLIDLTKKMENKIQSLLYYSQLSHIESAISEVDLDVSVREIISSIHPILEQENAKVIIDGTLPSIHCDRARISELFRNLISNGIKYNSAKEKIIRVGQIKHITPALEEFLVGQSNSQTNCDVFFVKDNGIGIDKSYGNEIFAMFKRLHRSKYGQGSGIGLTIVSKIIHKHGGIIWYEKNADEDGTTFYFTIPRNIIIQQASENTFDAKHLEKMVIVDPQ